MLCLHVLSVSPELTAKLLQASGYQRFVVIAVTATLSADEIAVGDHMWCVSCFNHRVVVSGRDSLLSIHDC